jgi:hypothetical protein
MLAAFGAVAAAQGSEDRSVVTLNSMVIATRGVAARLPENLSAAPGDGARLLVKFAGPPDAGQLARLRAASEHIYTYLPYDAFLIKPRLADGPYAQDPLADVGLAWSDVWQPAYKLSRFVSALTAENAVADGAPAPARILMLQAFPDANLDKLRAALRALGVPDAAVVGAQAGQRFTRLRLLLPAAEIVRQREALARLADVFWIDLESRRVLLNDTTVWVGQSGLSAGQTTPLFDRGLYGQGQVVGVLDTGIDPDMCYFRDTARGLPPRNECNGGTLTDTLQRKVLAVDFLWSSECTGGISGTEWDTQGHGTHVAGTVAGDNFANPLTHDAGDGMAPGAKLVVQDCGYQVNACADCPGIGCPVVDLNPVFQQAYSQGARLHTNSWGDQEDATVQNNYTTGSQDVDEFMWNHKDFLIFFAAGNSGPGTASVGSPSTAKSAVSVGATLRGTSANSMASFSSCGPTDDGRIKPEVTVPGSSIISAAHDTSITSNNCGTRSSSGTSMATPGAAGLTALIRQYYVDGWYPTGAANVGNAFTPSAALLRATLVNSAANMTGTTAIPANCQGWGRVLLDNALFFQSEARTLFVRDDNTGFASGSSNETRAFTFTVAAGQALKATLAWTDFPSTPAANPHINNDLDLSVSGPSGTFLGNVFASGQSTTGGAADRRNTLEQVLINAPVAGTYTVTVRSFSVPNGPQPFALVVTGAVTPASSSPDFSVACAPASLSVPQTGSTTSTCTVTSTNGFSSAVSLACTGLPAGATCSFSASPVTPPANGSVNSTLTVTTSGAAAATTAFQVVGTSGATTRSAALSLTVTPPGPVTVFFDNFETSLGWTTNPNATDTATSGQWERGDPEATNSAGVKQQGTTVSGVNDLVTARLAGASAGANDIDGGTTSIQSPAITLPATGTLTLSFSYYFAHGTNSSTADFFRVSIVGTSGTTQVFQELGSTTNDDATFVSQSVSLNAFAGQTVRILIQAADAAGASLVEAAVDDVRVTQQ